MSARTARTAKLMKVLREKREVAIARVIVAELFVDGSGQRVKRLLLEMEDGTNGGGYGPTGVLSIITKALAAQEVAS